VLSYRPSKNSIMNTLLEKSFMVRFLIHCVGDIHMPMHVVSRFTPKLLSGDLGGNKFNIIYRTLWGNNLHAFWDDLFGIVDDY